ncbi:hypothetical protein OE88DRAFT_1664365 [Heliocybe sulcata]|uniref:Uncharacterized protein n=1 Tax=Heliocybe sulcata TaxID=5364 RepID=A0A5C3MSQ3_9AGAM|nr:hypothetical protein OE88DRAFT_1664365 [Heliocybe sulcata]
MKLPCNASGPSKRLSGSHPSRWYDGPRSTVRHRKRVFRLHDRSCHHVSAVLILVAKPKEQSCMGTTRRYHIASDGQLYWTTSRASTSPP